MVTTRRRCSCGTVVASGRQLKPEEYVLCPQCGRDCSAAPGPRYRLGHFLRLLRGRIRSRNRFSFLECYQLPRERRRFHDNLKLKAERERLGIKRTGLTASTRDAGGTIREYGCTCSTCRPSHDPTAVG